MSSINIDPPVEPVPPTGGEPSGAGEVNRPIPSGIRVWAFALIAGAVAGVVSWGLGEGLEGRFRPELAVTAGGFPSPEEASATQAAYRRGEALEAAAAFGIMGAFLGCCLGAAGGLARGSSRSALIAGICGAICGAAVGAAAGWFVAPLHLLNQAEGDDLLQSFLIQSGIVIPLGVAGGVAFGMGLGGRSAALRSIVGGVVGAVIGAMAFLLIGAIALPLDGASNPLPETSKARLVGRLVVAVLIALGAARTVFQGPSKVEKPAASDLPNATPA